MNFNFKLLLMVRINLAGLQTRERKAAAALRLMNAGGFKNLIFYQDLVKDCLLNLKATKILSKQG